MRTFSKRARWGAFVLAFGLFQGASCSLRPATTLASGDYRVRIGSDGSVLSIASSRGRVETSGRKGAGDVFCGGRRFPLTAPLDSTAGENAIRLVYDLKELALGVEIVCRLSPGREAAVFSREVTLRSRARLPDDLTVSLSLGPVALPDETWLPLKNGTGAALAAADAAVYRFAGAAPPAGGSAR